MSTQTQPNSAAHAPGPIFTIGAVELTPFQKQMLAAAPDLLAALEQLCADKYLADPINADRMKHARAAILRAKGQA